MRPDSIVSRRPPQGNRWTDVMQCILLLTLERRPNHVVLLDFDGNPLRAAGRAGDAHLGPDARECVIRWQIIASALYFLATGPTSQGGETALLMMLLGALIAATALLVRHCTGGHGQGYFHF